MEITSSGLVSKLAKVTVFIIIFSFIASPLSSVFAQEADTHSEVSSPEAETTLSSENTDLEIPAESETPILEDEEVSPVDDIKPIDEDTIKPIDEEPEMMAMMAAAGPLSLLGDISESGNRITPEIDNTNGALIYEYKITVPPGRNEMTPDLALVYNSATSTKDSLIGAGWSINIPYIERVNKTGSDKLYTDNYFLSSMDGELVSLGSGNYAAKDENGDFLTYSLSSNVWTVKDKSGTVYKFGTNAAERQDNPGDSSKVYKWMLQEVRDTNDNYIEYTYYKDAGQIYPSQITYTGNGSTDGPLEVNFDRSSRSGAPKLFNTGFSVQSNYRITEIRTEINNTWARKYTLAYTNADNGTSSLLNTIIEEGQDDSSNVTTLPAVDFNYETADTDWTYNSSISMPLPFIASSQDRGVRVADINGDGLADFMCSNHKANYGAPCGRTDKKVFLNDGNGGWTDVSSTWLFPLVAGAGSNREAFVDANFADMGLRLMDVNGDMLTDLVRGDGSNKYIYINTGSGWAFSSPWDYALPLHFENGGTDLGMRMGDINGDGLPDLVCHNDTTSGSCRRTDPVVYLNNGSGWTDVSSTWLIPIMADNASKREYFTDGSGGDSGLRLVDVNGDGLSDLVRSTGTGYIYINNGSGWTYDSNWYLPTPFIYSGSDSGLRMSDINGDGLMDLLCHNDKTTSSACTKTDPKIFLNNGTGWTDFLSTWVFPVKNGGSPDTETFLDTSLQDRGLRVLDLNGDGLDDLAKSVYSGDNFAYINNEDVASNLLSQITYSQGGSTNVSYKATPLIKNGSTLLNPAMPIIFHTVSQISNSDGLGLTETYDYKYEGGLYYFNTYLDRKFAGFSKVTKTDAAGNEIINYFHQGNGTDSSNGEYSDHVSKIGKIYRTEYKDNSSNIYGKVINKWDRYNIGTDHNFVKLTRSLAMSYDGDSDHKDRAVEYTYSDTTGNLTDKVDWGEVTGSNDGTFSDTGSDKSTETISYVSNTGANIIGLPYQDTVVDQSSAKVRESKTYYDAQSLGSVTDGNVTKVEDWVTSSTYINNQKAYNTTYGIVTSETDPRGKVTTYTTYDTYNLYPITITDPLSQTTQYTYDYSIGKPKQVTDQNSFVYQTTYDGLDRVKEEKIPGFTNPYTPVVKTAYTYTDTAGAVKVQRTDNLDGSIARETYQYFDGLGRVIQERKEAESDYNVKDTVYSNRGLVLKESMPYTSSGSSKTSTTGTSTLYTNYTYDPLSRPSTVVSPLGTTSYAYDDWKTTITDAESNVKHYYKDARDNLIKVDEVNGGSTYTTNYEYNLNNKLTKITDALSNVRNFTYDGLGRRITAEDLHASADGTYGTWTYTYDNAGNLTQSVSPRSLTTNYTYNDINQQLTEDYTGAGGTEITYTYGGGCTNGIEKLCAVSMSSGANTSYTYDSNGNIASEAKTINGTTYTTSYTYDRQGNKAIITYPDSAEVRYTFNAAGLLNKIERKESGGAFTDVVSNFDYSPVDKVTTQADVNGVTTTNTYDAVKMYRLTRRLTQNTVPTKHQDLNYTYDNVNNITQIVDASAGSSSKTVAYVYDDLNRMTSATATSVAGGQSTYTHTYAYDALGNITSGPIGSYTYAGTNYANPHAATTINGVTYTYDNDGNLTGNGSLTNTWNYKDQLTQAVLGGVTSSYLYDHTGERASLANGTTTTAYPNDFYNYNGTKKTKSIYAGDQLVATIETVGGVVTPYYVHTDQLNSTTATSDGSAALVETLDYFPYGNQRISSGAHTEQRQYIGQMYDTDTGLDYLNARYYKADIGRFISQDSIFWQLSKESLIDPQQQNSYNYARNNPISMGDPTGKAVETLLDVVAVSYDVHALWQSIKNGDAWGALGNSSILIADLASTAMPFVPAIGSVRVIDKVFDTTKIVENSTDTAKGGVYTLTNPASGEVMRTGRTNDFIRREAEHAANSATKGLDFNVYKRTDDYATQRGVEQFAHNKYNPPLNKINPISPKNPNLGKYLDAAKKFLSKTSTKSQ